MERITFMGKNKTKTKKEKQMLFLLKFFYELPLWWVAAGIPLIRVAFMMGCNWNPAFVSVKTEYHTPTTKSTKSWNKLILTADKMKPSIASTNENIDYVF